MNAHLQRLHCPTIFDLRSYEPEDPKCFSFLLQVIVGPEGLDGEESFDIEVCMPGWLEYSRAVEEVVIGRHLLIVREYNFERLELFILGYLRRCSGENWNEVSAKVARLGMWEFEDYVP